MDTLLFNDNLLTELYEKELEAEKIAHDKFVLERKAWLEKYPNACEECHGRDGFVSNYDPSPSGVSLMSGSFFEYDKCNVLAKNQCHRCKKFGLNRQKELPCKFCGWNYGKNRDDSVPEW